jgi:predicted metal-dependent peptidase
MAHINEVITGLLLDSKYRLLASALCALEKQASNDIPTIAVALKKDGKAVLVYNNEYFHLSLNPADQAYVLLHEAAHMLLASFSRGAGKNRELWNAATDLVINSMLSIFLGVKPPKQAATFDYMIEAGVLKYGDYRESSAEEIYETLRKTLKSCRQEGAFLVLKNANGKTANIRRYDEVFDEESAVPEGAMGQAMKKLVREYSDAGTGSGNFARQLGKIQRKKFPFEPVLRKCFSRLANDWTRPNRRLRVKGSFVPRKRQKQYVIVAAIDVSGSCCELTEQFVGILKGMPEFDSVIFFDTAIKKIVKKGEKIPEKLNAYGGTCIDEPLKYFCDFSGKTQGLEANFLILTDGHVGPIKQKFPPGEVIALYTDVPVPGCRNIKIQ